MLAPRPTPELEDHPLSALRDCLFNIFAATLHIGGSFSIRNLRTRHAVVTGTHKHGYSGYIQDKSGRRLWLALEECNVAIFHGKRPMAFQSTSNRRPQKTIYRPGTPPNFRLNNKKKKRVNWVLHLKYMWRFGNAYKQFYSWISNGPVSVAALTKA